MPARRALALAEALPPRPPIKRKNEHNIMVTLHLSTDNAAFKGETRGDEIARILRGAADRIEGNEAAEQFNLYDANGNTVGRVYDNDQTGG